MTKQIHYLIIATHLPSDSEVIFYDKVEDAQAEFQKRTQEIFALDENLEEEVDFWCEDSWAVRFNAGNNEALSNFLGDVDHLDLIGQSHFLQSHRNFSAIGGVKGKELNASRRSIPG